jgi:hypothetical protein
MICGSYLTIQHNFWPNGPQNLGHQTPFNDRNYHPVDKLILAESPEGTALSHNRLEENTESVDPALHFQDTLARIVEQSEVHFPIPLRGIGAVPAVPFPQEGGVGLWEKFVLGQDGLGYVPNKIHGLFFFSAGVDSRLVLPQLFGRGLPEVGFQLGRPVILRQFAGLLVADIYLIVEELEGVYERFFRFNRRRRLGLALGEARIGRELHIRVDLPLEVPLTEFVPLDHLSVRVIALAHALSFNQLRVG